MKTINTIKPASILLLALMATGCASLHDEQYNWCGKISCPAPEVAAEQQPTPAIPHQTETLTLMADALFKFDRSGINDILPAGKEKLDKLADRALSRKVSLNEIIIIGYADRLGSTEYNQHLSEARARTVATYLQSKGITTPMQVLGKGEAMPVTTDCRGEKATKTLIQCLSADRRVTVDLIKNESKP